MRRLLFILPLLIIAGSCKKNKLLVKNPYKANLVYPANNEACLTGTVVSGTQNSIQFKWNKAVYTDDYDVVVKNLETGLSTTYPAGNNTQLDIVLPANVPYSWYVISKLSTSTSTAQSDTWKFYNAGTPLSFYAPFPADILSPAMGANVTASNNKITLDWNGSDADNDIVFYDVYMGTSITPVLLVGNVAASILPDVSVTSNTIYYWKIITKDAKGNTSDSGLYQFKVN